MEESKLNSPLDCEPYYLNDGRWRAMVTDPTGRVIWWGKMHTTYSEAWDEGKSKLNELTAQPQSQPQPTEPVTPAHYDGTKVLDFIVDQNLSFGLGNVVKYACRYKLKGGLEDLRKARTYLDYEIQRLEKEEESDAP